MDTVLAKYGDAYGRISVWKKYGGGKRASPEETDAWLEYIAKDDVRYANALFEFMIVMTMDWSWARFNK